MDWLRTGIGNEYSCREGYKYLIAQASQSNIEILSPTHTHKRLRLVLEKPTGPTREVWDSEESANDPIP